MANILLLCDSNLSRRTQRIEKDGKVKVVKCTNSGAFRAAIVEANENIFVAGIESIVNEAMGASADPLTAVTTGINLLMLELRNKVERNKALKVGIAPMLPWTRFDKKTLAKAEAAIKEAMKIHAGKFYFAETCKETLRLQKSDGVHLTDQSADLYADYIMAEIDRMMEDRSSGRKRKADDAQAKKSKRRNAPEDESDWASAVESEGNRPDEEDEQEGTVVNFGQGKELGEVESESEEELPRKKSLARELHERIIAIEDKGFQDNLMFAKQQEELDAIANEKSLDRVIFTGMYIEGFYRMSGEEKIEIMKSKTQALVHKVMGAEDIRIEFVNQVNKSARSGPVTMNARFNSGEAAKLFRGKFARMMKDHNRDGTMPNEYRGINVMPSQRLATRVRIDIMRSIADYIMEETDGKARAFVIAHIPKPILKVEIARKGATYTRSLEFTEAIEYVRIHHDRSLRGLKLHQAYARAGSAFKRNLQQYFVILK